MLSLEEYRKLPENWDVVVFRDVDWDVRREVYRDVDWDVPRAVARDVYWDVGRAVTRAVTRAVSQEFDGGFKEPSSKLSSLVTIARILWGAVMAWFRNLGGTLVDR